MQPGAESVVFARRDPPSPYPVPRRTTACSRRLPAYAPTSLRLPGAAEAQRSAAVHIMKTLEEGIGHFASPTRSFSTLHRMTKRPRAASLGQYAVFSLAVCTPVDYHV